MTRFLEDLRLAIHDSRPFAASKLGYSEIFYLDLPSYTSRPKDPIGARALNLHLRVHARRQSPIFSADENDIAHFCHRYQREVSEIDYLAIAPTATPPNFLQESPSPRGVIPFNSLEPDRSIPYRSENCYLPSLVGKDLLLIGTDSDLFTSRATKEIFEKVWVHSGIPWFEPRSITSLTFPSMYATATRQSYESVWDLLTAVRNEMQQRTFDVALISAAILGAPIATEVKRLGKVGLNMGAHQQVLWGVYGSRWARDPQWSQFINSDWLRMPHERIPSASDGLVDDGAYW